MNKNEQTIIDDFLKLYVSKRLNFGLKWMGHQMSKLPTDLFMYQQILFEKQPDILIECGSGTGGSTLFFAHIMDIVGRGIVLSIDVQNQVRPEHNRIKYIHGSSVDEKVIEAVKSIRRASSSDSIMVSLDSDHHYLHVLKEMELYGELITPGQYMVVEDTIVNGNPIRPHYGPGPKEAIKEFLSHHGEFAVEKEWTRLLLSTNYGGYLQRRGR